MLFSLRCILDHSFPVKYFGLDFFDFLLDLGCGIDLDSPAKKNLLLDTSGYICLSFLSSKMLDVLWKTNYLVIISLLDVNMVLEVWQEC